MNWEGSKYCNSDVENHYCPTKVNASNSFVKKKICKSINKEIIKIFVARKLKSSDQ